MDLLDRTIREVKEESAYVAQHLQRWWGSMDSSQQAFTLGTICAAFLLIGILQPAPKKASMISGEQGWDRSTMKAFILAAVVLLILTFGLDIAIESVR